MTPETSAAHAASDHRPVFVAEPGRSRTAVRVVGWAATAVVAAWLAAVVAGAAGFGSIPGLSLPGVPDAPAETDSRGEPSGAVVARHARGSERAPAHGSAADRPRSPARAATHD